MGFLDFIKKSFKTQSVQKTVIQSYRIPSAVTDGVNPYIGKYSEHGIDEAVYLLYCDYGNAYQWMLDAAKPESYFANYKKSIQILEALCQYLGKYRFELPSPDQQLDTLKSNYVENTNRFIERYWNNNLAAAQKLKTEKGKANRINKFFDSLLMEYRQYLFEDNISFIDRFRDCDTPVQQQISKINVVCKDYDMQSVEGIMSIPRTDQEVMRPLQKCATNHKRNGDIDLAIACLRKSNQISDYSPPRERLMQKEYLRILSYIKLKKDESEYQAEETLIKQRHPEFWDKRISNLQKIQDQLKNIQHDSYSTDLVTVICHSTCPICYKYARKVYSISGIDKRYPKLPDEVINQTHSCLQHSMSLNPFYDGISTPPEQLLRELQQRNN